MAASMRAAVKKKLPHSHTHGRDATFLYAPVCGWVLEADGAKIVNNIDDNDGIECWRKLARRFNPQTAPTKGARLRGITCFAEKHTAKNTAQVPAVIEFLEKCLRNYTKDFSTEALSEDVKKDTLLQIIPQSLATLVQDFMILEKGEGDESGDEDLFADMSYDKLKRLILSRVNRDV